MDAKGSVRKPSLVQEVPQPGDAEPAPEMPVLACAHLNVLAVLTLHRQEGQQSSLVRHICRPIATCPISSELLMQHCRHRSLHKTRLNVVALSTPPPGEKRADDAVECQLRSGEAVDGSSLVDRTTPTLSLSDALCDIETNHPAQLS